MVLFCGPVLTDLVVMSAGTRKPIYGHAFRAVGFLDLQVPLQTYPGRSSSVEGDEGVEGSAPQHH